MNYNILHKSGIKKDVITDLILIAKNIENVSSLESYELENLASTISQRYYDQFIQTYIDKINSDKPEDVTESLYLNDLIKKFASSIISSDYMNLLNSNFEKSIDNSKILHPEKILSKEYQIAINKEFDTEENIVETIKNIFNDEYSSYFTYEVEKLDKDKSILSSKYYNEDVKMYKIISKEDAIDTSKISDYIKVILIVSKIIYSILEYIKEMSINTSNHLVNDISFVGSFKSNDILNLDLKYTEKPKNIIVSEELTNYFVKLKEIFSDVFDLFFDLLGVRIPIFIHDLSIYEALEDESDDNNEINFGLTVHIRYIENK